MIKEEAFSAEFTMVANDSPSCRYIPVRVEVPEDEKIFLSVPERIYQDDPFWIPPLEGDISSVFDVTKNPYFAHGQAVRWILFDQSGLPCGRIAAFVDFHKQFEGNKRLGGIGFFECIEDQSAAHVLFNAALDWLTGCHQVQIVDGPINFGENDKYWGLLVEGAGPVAYGMNYNPPYYITLFQSFGFSIHYKQLTNYISLLDPLPERFVKIAGRVERCGKYEFESLKYRDRARFIRDFTAVYNRAWSSFRNFHPMGEAVLEKSLADMRPIMIEEFIWFAYANGEPIGVLVVVPDVNEIIRHAGPKLDLWGRCKFLFYKWLKGFTTVRVVVMGVVPEYQNHGIESALILHVFNELQKRPGFKHVQLSWVGDFNEKMIAIHKAMNAIEYTQHATFRKLL